ncbi:iron-sulfur cluster co-chaperone HscB C-terminal domain-containing protein [Lewinella sp. JB7]|uniref:iron-sulfur cluster co-chaperone HscB C-terminal domain-containing protein n=1 Tax=Lewinella sp. JB7 TaxID=2962887 RepID=UPI0020C9CA4B|nr:iron-sulfur cluster co-chaperone HscB C-terminal domain-containing protein [Lewinella sp. JB7]MCP9237326.1 Fe-S protein assembly co-chaperone HscB [Lewinella sp. JB7]
MTNYFSFFGLRPSPTLDHAALKKTFYANSKRFHPDFHTLENADTQEEVLEKSTLNNQGYKILTDEDLRLRHFLEVKGVLGEEGTNQVPQDFLLEIMEVNEALMELEFENDPSVRLKVTGLVDQLESDLQEEVHNILTNYDDATASDAELTALKNYYLKRRYLLRLREKI